MSKIILILMIKNESKILKRCVDAISNFVDGFCITDTGSTDDTVTLIPTIMPSDKPWKLYETIFKNFGHTRTESFVNTKEFVTELGWDLDTTYGLLLDADMVLKISDNFDRNSIGPLDAYQIIQTQGCYDYQNTRFIKMSLNWKCIGSTHEFWKCDESKTLGIFTSKKLWIDDVSDGGCKSDKYTRDERLLLSDLEEAEKKGNTDAISRSLFYLGQTYMCLGNLEKAIEFYKKRVEIESWSQETWFATYMIGYCYMRSGDFDSTVEWCKKAWDLSTTKTEPACFIAEIYVAQGKYEEAMEWVEKGINIEKDPKDILFTNNDVYRYGFYLQKFIIMTKIESTKKIDLFNTAQELLKRLPSNHSMVPIVEYVIKTCTSDIPLESQDDSAISTYHCQS